MTEKTSNSQPRSTLALADFVCGLTYDDLPSDVRERIPGLLVDFFRVSAAGAHTPWMDKLKRVFGAGLVSGEAPILYSDQRHDRIRAAFLNGTMAGSLEWDDTHVGAMLHPGVVVWPAILAAAEGRQVSGKQIVAAAAAGYETIIRVGLSIQPSHFKRGYQSTATCGVFGAAAAAAKILGLGKHGIADSLGLAASYAGGLTQFFVSGSEVKRIHAGKAAAAGVEAALMAEAGLTGPHDIIEGSQGFARAYADVFDPKEIEQGLGSTYHLQRLQLKPHACSARVLAAVEAAEALAPRISSIEDIVAVEIGVPSVIVGRLTGNAPADLQQTQMSAPFAVAMTLAAANDDRTPLVFGIPDFEKALATPAIRALSLRTQCVVDEEIERWTTQEYVPARVTLTLRDGSSIDATIREPKGCPERPMSVEELIERFKVVVGELIPGDALDRWISSVMRLETLTSMDELMRLRIPSRP